MWNDEGTALFRRSGRHSQMAAVGTVREVPRDDRPARWLCFGISAYWCPENKVSLGFVDGLNNQIW